MKKSLLCLFFYCFIPVLAAQQPIVNVYIWGGEIPDSIIRQFEEKTGIKVNLSTYDSNETMYTKLHASKKAIYDVVLPTGYFVERLKKQGMLMRLDHQKLPHANNIDPLFTHSAYDINNQYSIPIIWGSTGIFFNQLQIKAGPKTWRDLWNKRWRGQLMLLDDSREVFAMALLSLGFSPNDQNPQHIEVAYQALLQLVPNIKLFASEGIQSLIIDGDAALGAAWNGDAYKAQAENKTIQYQYPADGFVIWVDCLAIPANAPHPANAYQFIDFVLEAQNAVEIALQEGHAITNAAGKRLLPDHIRNNPMVYPSPAILRHSYIQQDVSEATIALYNQYWQAFKLAF